MYLCYILPSLTTRGFLGYADSCFITFQELISRSHHSQITALGKMQVETMNYVPCPGMMTMKIRYYLLHTLQLIMKIVTPWELTELFIVVILVQSLRHKIA